MRSVFDQAGDGKTLGVAALDPRYAWKGDFYRNEQRRKQTQLRSPG